MNSTIRTINRVVVFFGALLTGLLATLLGYRMTIGIGAAIFLVAALIVMLSPLFTARHGDQPPTA
jgi:predicted MFS family arabinose efflux permease